MVAVFLKIGIVNNINYGFDSTYRRQKEVLRLISSRFNAIIS